MRWSTTVPPTEYHIYFTGTPTPTHNHSSRERHNDEVGSVDPLLLNEVRAEGNGLDGLPQTHLVCQDTVEVVVVQ